MTPLSNYLYSRSLRIGGGGELCVRQVYERMVNVSTVPSPCRWCRDCEGQSTPSEG